MLQKYKGLHFTPIVLLILLAVIVSACNLGASTDEQPLETVSGTSQASLPTRTVAPTSGPTLLPITQVAFPTNTPIGNVVPFPTRQPGVVLPPTLAPFPTTTPLPLSIVILSPIPGNVVAGNVQILGAATHPQFLQFQVEFGPDPNPGNLWYPITGVIQTPIIQGRFGIWNTTIIPDGLYQLRLRVFLRDGTELATVNNSIRVQNTLPTPVPTQPTEPRPIAAFTQDRTIGDAPLAVRFTNQSSGRITSYSWNFGDGSSGTEVHPTHTYRNPGVYTVTLTVVGPGGSSNVSRQIRVQSPTAPVAAFTQDKVSGPSPLDVTFTNQSTGNITTYNWNFGDGTTSNERNPSHRFTDVGTYNVILEVIGPGGSSSVRRQITVENPAVPPPQAAFTQSATEGFLPLAVQFTNQSCCPDTINEYLWDFGDGNTSNQLSPSHTFEQEGTFTVRLTVVGDGGQSEATVDIVVRRRPDAPVAEFTANPEQGNIPLDVTFTNASIGDITEYAWDFNGDGTVDSNQQNPPAYRYDSEGSYNATLTVRGPGGENTKTVVITAIDPIAAPTADFEAPDAAEVGQTVTFVNLSTGEQLSFAWDFNNDGTVDSTDRDPSTTYDTPNTYTVKLTVTNPVGTVSVEHQIVISEPPPDFQPPIAQFSVTPTEGVGSLEVAFSNTSVGDIAAYEWDFTSDGIVDDTNPTPPNFTFTNTGTDPIVYTITLRAIGLSGEVSTATQTVTVQPAPPAPDPAVAAFTVSPTEGTGSLEVAFTNQSTGDITAYEWDFEGDGIFDFFDANPPNFTYTNTTPDVLTFTPRLRVTGADGNASEATQTVTVQPAPPAPDPAVAAFTVSPTEGTGSLEVAFTNQSTGDITAYEWDFEGDGIFDFFDANPPNFTYTNTTPDVLTFTPRLRVTGADGNASEATQTVTVQPAPPAPDPAVAAFTVSPTEGTGSLEVAFTNQSTGDITAYEWDFEGDGIFDFFDANPPNFTYTNTTPDVLTFTPRLRVTGADGNASEATQTVTVQPAPPTPDPAVAAFTVSPTEGTGSLEVAFTNQSTGDITAYEWDFEGDGIFDFFDANPPNFTYTNTTPDVLTFTPRLRVTGADGNASEATQTVTVQPDLVPVVDRPLIFVTNRDGNREIYAMGENGESALNLTNNGAEDFDPAWSPDGSRIAFVSTRAGDADIFVMNADGSGVTQLTFDASDETSPAWSPDGNRIAFVTDRDGNREIYVMNADGSGATNITNAPGSDEFDPHWGSRILFVSNRDGNNEIYVMDADGLNPTNLSNSPDSSEINPRWSNNGAQIAFASDRDANQPGIYDIFTSENDGKGAINRTASPDRTDVEPAWSQDDGKIIYRSDFVGNDEITVINANGANAVTLTNNGSSDTNPDWRP